MIHSNITKFNFETDKELFLVTDSQSLKELEDFTTKQLSELIAGGYTGDELRLRMRNIYVITTLEWSKFIRMICLGVNAIRYVMDLAYISESVARNWITAVSDLERDSVVYHVLQAADFNSMSWEGDGLQHMYMSASKLQLTAVLDVLNTCETVKKGLESPASKQNFDVVDEQRTNIPDEQRTNIPDEQEANIPDEVEAGTLDETETSAPDEVIAEPTTMESDFRMREQELQIKEQVLQEKEQILQNKQQALQDKEQMLQNKEQVLQDKEQSIHTQESTLQARVQEISAKEQQVLSTQSTDSLKVTELEAKVNMLNSVLSGMRNNKLYLESQIVELKTHQVSMSTSDTEANTLRTELCDAHATITSLEAQVATLQQRIYDLTQNEVSNTDLAEVEQLNAIILQYQQNLEVLSRKYTDSCNRNSSDLNTPNATNTAMILPVIDDSSFLGSAKIVNIHVHGDIPYVEDLVSYLNAYVKFALSEQGKRGIVIVADPLISISRKINYETMYFSINERPNDYGNDKSVLVTDERSMVTLKETYQLNTYDYIVLVDRYDMDQPFLNRQGVPVFHIAGSTAILDKVMHTPNKVDNSTESPSKFNPLSMINAKSMVNQHAAGTVRFITFFESAADYVVVLPETYLTNKMQSRLGLLSAVPGIKNFCKDVLHFVE